MCYGKTKFTPGRYLEDGLKGIGIEVDLYTTEINFSKVDLSKYMAVLFVESPSRPAVIIQNIHLVKIPKIFWIHHGENRIETNLVLAKKYEVDLVLMAHSLHLAKRFVAPVKFFPFAMAKDFFNCSLPLRERKIDISSVGTLDSIYYHKRINALKAIKTEFANMYKMSFNRRVFLEELAKLYSSSKIVVNHTADTIKSFNMRIFEGMGCGALVLTDYVPKIEEIFTDGKHLVIFENRHDLIEKIDYYLNNIDEAEKIAKAGYEHLISNHTYEHRAQQLIDMIQSLK